MRYALFHVSIVVFLRSHGMPKPINNPFEYAVLMGISGNLIKRSNLFIR